MPPSGEPVDKTVGKRSTRNMGQRKLPAGEVSNDVPKTPSRPTKRGRVSDSLKDAPPASPASSLTKKLKTLKLGDNDDEESELSELDETSTISDDGADSSKAPPLEDPFVEKASVPASSAKNVEPEKETVYLEDLRGVIRCSSLPSSNGISPHVRDEDLYKLFPRMPEPPLVLGHFITWMNRDDDYAAMRPVILNYMAYYYKQFPDSSVLLRNIGVALSTSFSGRFYNAACSDPRDFIAKQSATSNSPRFELYTKGGRSSLAATG